MKESLVAGLGEPRKAPQHLFVLREPVAEGLLGLDKARDMVGDRCRHWSVLPIQGWATSCNMTESVLE